MIGSHGRRLLAGAVVSTVAARKKYREDHFTYAELEENDEDLTKLRNWFAKIEHRDAFGAPGRQTCADALLSCAYAAWAYASEADGS